MNEQSLTFEEVLNRDGFLVYTNVGFSMMPLIREGRDVLYIERRDTDSLKKYDVVLFKRDNVEGRGKYVLHRILKVLPDNKYWIVGDNCIGGETVDASVILGVLKSVSRGGKTVVFDGAGYRLYVLLWCAPYRLRFLLLRIKEFFERVLDPVVSRLKKRH